MYDERAEEEAIDRMLRGDVDVTIPEAPVDPSSEVLDIADDSAPVEDSLPAPRRSAPATVSAEERTTPPSDRTPPPREREYDTERGLAAWLFGAGGVQQVDGRRAAARARRDAARRQVVTDDLAAQKNRREQEKHDLEMDVMKPLKAEHTRSKIEESKLKVEAGRQSVDPSSPYSQTMRKTVADRFLAEAGIVGARDPEAARMLEQTAKNIASNERISAQQLIDIAKQFGPVGSRALQAAHSAAMEDIAGANLGLSRARLDLDETREDRLATKDFNVSVKNPQEKLNREISDLSVALKEMEDAGRLKGKVNTGPIINLFAKIGENFDMTSDERIDLEATVARVFNKETKSLAGAAVSAQEWARISPQIPQPKDDDRVFIRKLRKAMEATRDILAARKQEYQMRRDGGTVDQSVTAKRNAPLGERPSSATPEPGEPKLPDPKKAAKAVRAKKVLSDPSMSEKAKAGARKWLQENGYGG